MVLGKHSFIVIYSLRRCCIWIYECRDHMDVNERPECVNTSATRRKHNPCELYRDIHFTEGRSRVHTSY